MLCFQSLSAMLAYVASWFLKLGLSRNPNIKRLLSTPLRAGSISPFSTFWFVSAPRGVICKTPSSPSRTLQGFSSYQALVIFFLQTWLNRPLGGLWQAGRSYGTDSLRMSNGHGEGAQTLTEEAVTQLEAKPTCYFLKIGREENQEVRYSRSSDCIMSQRGRRRSRPENILQEAWQMSSIPVGTETELPQQC